MDEARMSKGWRRLVAISCTLLLAGSLFLFLGMTVWAQDEPVETEETTTEETTTEQPAETEETATQPAPTSEEDGLTIEYWEPQVGTRTVYYINDYMNNIYGQKFELGHGVGYLDDILLYLSSILFIDYTSSYYEAFDAVSDMNPVYFDLEGPWYFSMTTPHKVVKEVKGIHEAPDAAQFPEATYAVWTLAICSGGHRTYAWEYKSNDATTQEWKTWGYTLEYVPPDGSESRVKDIIHFYSQLDPDMKVPKVESFPKSVGDTGSIDALVERGDINYRELPSGTYEILAEGEIMLPGGTFDALLIKESVTTSSSGQAVSSIVYRWFVKDIGTVVYTRSLPDILGPLYGETTGFEDRTEREFYQTEGMMVLEEQTGPEAEQQ